MKKYQAEKHSRGCDELSSEFLKLYSSGRLIITMTNISADSTQP